MAGLIRNEDIQQVRERARIDDLVGAHVTLKRAGVGSLKGLCPFHDERTPSFHVRPQLGLYHCFGCGEGGDVIDFVMKINHLPFVEAVEYLAAQLGYTLRYEQTSGTRPNRDPNRRARLIAAHSEAAEFYSRYLTSSDAYKAREFLSQRGFDKQAAEHFGVGYAPQGWTHLFDYLRKKGFTEGELQSAGLISQGRSGSYDRFRGRLVWPIRDVTGAVVGFGARKLFDDDPGPKYLNTPETPIYKKAQILYGLDLAKRDIAREKRVVVVEGYTDVMAMHLAGETTAVATCGTAFGPEHIKVVRRILGDSATAGTGVMLTSGQTVGGEVIFTFDGDEAGKKAALRAFEQDQQFAAQTFVAIEAGGLDPCDLRLAQGDAAVLDLVSNKKPLFEFAIESVIKDIDLNLAEGRVAGLRAGAPVVARIRDTALRAEYARRLAGWLGMDEATVLRAVNTSTRRRPTPEPPQGAENMPQLNLKDPVVRLEHHVLALVLQLPEEALNAGFDDFGAETFTVPVLRAVHDVIRSVGGVEAFAEKLEALQAQENNGINAHQQALATWAEEILQSAGPLTQVITQLAVSPLPHDQPEYIGAWAQDMVKALARMVLTRKIGDLRAQLARTNPTDEQYSTIFTQLIEVEKQHRELTQF